MDGRAYLDRLGLDQRAPSLAALRELHLRHLQRVPFENLDIHRGVPIIIDERAHVRKVVGGRGGFCYELNGAFGWLLRTLGYEVTLLEAQVATGDGGYGIRFDHLALRVDLDEPYLVDVGFGESFVEPILLTPDEPVRQLGTDYRLTSAPDQPRRALVLERRRPDADWIAQYRLDLTPRSLDDFAPGCAYHQTAASHFTKGPICTRLDGDERVTLHRDRLTRAGVTTPITSDATWRSALQHWFGIEA